MKIDPEAYLELIRTEVEWLLNETSSVKIANELIGKKLGTVQPVMDNPKPRLAATHTSDDVLTYASSLRKYEHELESFNQKKIAFNNTRQTIRDIMYEYIKSLGDLNCVPEQYRAKVFEKAKNLSDGSYQSIYDELTSLIEIFE